MTKIETIARKHYGKLPYHNFAHALKVRRVALKFIHRCKKYKVPVNREIVEIAALFHDAGYDKVKNNKEELAGKITARELKTLKYPTGAVKQVQQTIMATKAGYPLKTTEQKILRAADLSSFTESYKNFLAASKKIEREYHLLHDGRPFPIRAWTKSILSYLKPKIQLTPKYYRDNFHAKAIKNIDRYLKNKNIDNLTRKFLI
ncbi:MAG: HD domain-containing protein [Patescibacteria group bacterium]